MVFLFLPELCDSLSEFIKLFLQRVFFLILSRQRDYNYFCCIIETTFLRMLIGLTPRRDIRESISFSRDLHSAFSYKGAI